MGEKLKLTKAQWEWLRLIAKNPRIAMQNYKPAVKLVELGLSTRARVKWSSVCEFQITDAGRAALHPSETAQRREGDRG